MCELTVKVILTDIEGTTTSISFVKDVLFPYAKKNCKQFLEQTWTKQETVEIVQDLLELPQFEEFKSDASIGDVSYDVTTVNDFVQYLIDADLKVGPLKKLQGLVWEKGYQSGEIKGHVYSDVPTALKKWHDAGLRLAIYSSGSIKAQKLLFSNTEFGDLVPFISEHFDTTSGHKQENQSYVNIANAMSINPKDIVFLTDVVAEAEAARQSGYQTVILSRPGNEPLTDDDKTEFCIVENFESLPIKCK